MDSPQGSKSRVLYKVEHPFSKSLMGTLNQLEEGIERNTINQSNRFTMRTEHGGKDADNFSGTNSLPPQSKSTLQYIYDGQISDLQDDLNMKENLEKVKLGLKYQQKSSAGCCAWLAGLCKKTPPVRHSSAEEISEYITLKGSSHPSYISYADSITYAQSSQENSLKKNIKAPITTPSLSSISKENLDSSNNWNSRYSYSLDAHTVNTTQENPRQGGGCCAWLSGLCKKTPPLQNNFVEESRGSSLYNNDSSGSNIQTFCEKPQVKKDLSKKSSIIMQAVSAIPKDIDPSEFKSTTDSLYTCSLGRNTMREEVQTSSGGCCSWLAGLCKKKSSVKNISIIRVDHVEIIDNELYNVLYKKEEDFFKVTRRDVSSTGTQEHVLEDISLESLSLSPRRILPLMPKKTGTLSSDPSVFNCIDGAFMVKSESGLKSSENPVMDPNSMKWSENDQSIFNQNRKKYTNTSLMIDIDETM